MGEKDLAEYDQFEKVLMQNTTEFYMNKADLWFTSLSCHEYIVKVEEHLDKEEKNADYFLQESTKPKMVNILLAECVENKADSLCATDMGCMHMFDNRKID